MSNDLNLWGEFKKGNRDAFEKIYRSEFKALYQYGNKFSRDTNLIEDCIQELFIELWKSKDRIANTDSIRRYLLVSLRRKIIRLVKSRSSTVMVDSAEELPYSVELNIESKIVALEISEEKKERVKKIFDTLSARQKEAFYLKYYSDCKNEEIAEIMGISNQSVRNLIHRALDMIRKNKSQ